MFLTRSCVKLNKLSSTHSRILSTFVFVISCLCMCTGMQLSTFWSVCRHITGTPAGVIMHKQQSNRENANLKELFHYSFGAQSSVVPPGVAHSAYPLFVALPCSRESCTLSLLCGRCSQKVSLWHLVSYSDGFRNCGCRRCRNERLDRNKKVTVSLKIVSI